MSIRGRWGRAGLGRGLCWAFAFSLAAGGAAQAETKTWVSAVSGNWSDGSKWSPPGAPAAGDDVVIDAAGSFEVLVDVSGVQVRSLVLGSSSSSAVLRLIGYDLALGAGGCTIGSSGTLRLAGATYSGPTFAAGAFLTNTGFIDVSGTARIIAPDETSFTNAAGAIIYVYSNSGHAKLTIENGITNHGIINIANYGTGTGPDLAQLLVTSGTLINESDGVVRYHHGNSGYYNQPAYILAELDNRGTVRVDGQYGLILEKSGAAHSNSGTIVVANSNLEIRLPGNASFSHNGDITVASTRTLTISQGFFDFQPPGTFSLSGGTLTVTAGAMFENHNSLTIPSGAQFNLSGRLDGGTTFTNQGSAWAVHSTLECPVVNEGSFQINGTSNVTGTLTTAPGSSLQVYTWDGYDEARVTISQGFTNHGTINIANYGTNPVKDRAELTVATGTLVNENGGVIRYHYGNSGYYNGPAYLNLHLDNRGTLAVDGIYGLVLAQSSGLYANNSGVMDVTASDFTVVNGSLNNSGSINISPSRKMVLSNVSCTNEPGGVLAYNGGTLQMLAASQFNFQEDHTIPAGSTFRCGDITSGGGELNGPGRLRNEGQLEIYGGTANLDVTNAAYLYLRNRPCLVNGQFANLPGATLDVYDNDVTFAHGFVNEGDFAFGCYNGVDSTVRVTDGVLVNAATGHIWTYGTAHRGGYRIEAELDNQGSIVHNGNGDPFYYNNGGLVFNRSGAHHVNSGTISVGTSNTCIEFSLTGGPTDSFLNAGTINVPSGKIFLVRGGGTFVHGVGGVLLPVNGTVWIDGNSKLQLAEDLTIPSGGTLRMGKWGGNGGQLNGPGRIRNEGTLEVWACAMTADVTNASEFYMYGGTTTMNGAFANLAGARLDVWNADATFANGFTNDGRITFGCYNGTNSYLRVTSGTLVNSPTGTLETYGQGGRGAYTVGAELNNQGIVTHNGTGDEFYYNNGGLVFSRAGAQHVNTGTINLGASNTCIEFGLTGGSDSFTNAGTINIPPGKNFLVRGGGTFVNSAGTINALGELEMSEVTGGGLQLTGGELVGTGVVQGNRPHVTNTGGTVRPGSSPGTLTINGDYTQQSGGTLDIEVGGYTAGTEFDRLNVGGTASLAGTLRSTLINGFAPIPSDQFLFLSAGTRTGTFSSVVPCNDTVTYASNSASLSFDRQPPTITDQPDPLTVNVGDSAIFTVAATGGGTITYQWRRDGGNLSDGPTGSGSTIGGATTATLTISNAQTGDDGDYDCVVSDDCGSGPSDAATLTVEDVACISWEQMSPSGPTPSERSSACLAFDSSRNVSVLFGGILESGGYSNETWEWDGTAWIQRFGAAPSARWRQAMVYDSARGVAVMFGGKGAADYFGDTWEWNGATWTQRSNGGPSKRESHAMAYDSARGVTVLFGGRTSNMGQLSRETWEWNGSTWSLRSNTGPVAQYEHAMAYDSARGVTVLFDRSGQTWEWDGTSWTQRSTSGPSARSRCSLAFDSDRGLTVLFGGYVGNSNSTLDDTWEWDGVAWAQRTIAGPSDRFSAALCFDSARNVMVLMGGYRNIGGQLDDTWELGGGAAVQITNQPDSLTVAFGNTATFSVAATGGGMLSYQWRKGGVDLTDGQTVEGSTISGSTTATLTIDNAQFGDESAYDCVVLNACGAVDSDDANLDVNPVSGPRLFLVRMPNNTCIGPGDTITVQVRMADLASQNVDGFQAFLAYDSAKLDYTGGDYTAAPFGEHLIDPIAVNEATGQIDLAAGIDVLHGQLPTNADALLATMTFTVLGGGGSTAVSFRTHDPPSLLSFDGDDIGADLHNLPALDIDVTPPVIVLPEDVTIECTDLTDPSFTGSATVTDDMDPNPTVTYSDAEAAGACPQERTITRRWRAEDCAGNVAEADQVIEVQDTTPPTMDTAAAGQTVECDGSGNATELTAWLSAQGGASATDACGNVTWTHNFTALSDDCGATGSATVTFTATDECGNSSTTMATFTIEDTTPPTIDTAAADQTVECDGAGNNAALTAWLVGHGGASASDLCGGVTWSHDFIALSDGCGATGAASVTFTATDACGNTSTTTATFTIEDTTPPTIDTPAANLAVECDGAGNPTELDAWLNGHGGAAASDACGGVTWSHDFTALSNGCGATGSATVTFTATDACGNTATTAANFSIADTTPPVIGTVAADQTFECDGAGNSADLAAWLATHGGADASDVCGGVTWSDDFTALSDGCGATGAASVTFTATDECGNSSTTSATFAIEDTTPPVVTPPADISVDADAGGCTALLSVGQGTADDDCDGDPITVTGVRSDALPLGDPYPGGATTTITWSATDACGNTGTAQQLVTVSNENVVEVDSVQLDGVNQASLTRCINFELIDCEGSTVTREEEVLFTSGLSGPITLRVPCGAYECISARDRKHTLKRVDTDDFAIDAAVYVASFMDAGGDNDALQGGNLNDSAYIDILDFSIFVARWNTNYGTGDTSCALSSRHADISGNGVVFTEDFTFIQVGFLDAADGACCGLDPDGGGDDDGPIVDISIEELIEMGEGELTVADLTEDGRINGDDVTAFMSGERPKRKPKHEGGASDDPTPPNRVGRIRP